MWPVFDAIVQGGSAKEICSTIKDAELSGIMPRRLNVSESSSAWQH